MSKPSSGRAVHVVLPAGVDDPARPSGGNFYDRRVCAGLTAAGWEVHEHPVAGNWPEPESSAVDELARELAAIPSGGAVLIDGLIGSAAAGVLVPEADRLRVVVLVHLPIGGAATGPAHASEAAVLSAAAAVLTTSGWTRDRLLECYPLEPDRVHVALPGVDPAEPSPGTAAGGELLCVAAISAHKGHDVLVEALAAVADLPWHCRCVGSLDRDPAFTARLRAMVTAAGLDDRIEFLGPRTGPALGRCYAAADLHVLASRGETYGMVVAEALAHGLPVLATDVGGVREALGAPPAGMLVAPGDAPALAEVVRGWLGDPALRHKWRRAALERRLTLPSWSVTVDRVAATLDAVAAPTG